MAKCILQSTHGDPLHTGRTFSPTGTGPDRRRKDLTQDLECLTSVFVMSGYGTSSTVSWTRRRLVTAAKPIAINQTWVVVSPSRWNNPGVVSPSHADV